MKKQLFFSLLLLASAQASIAMYNQEYGNQELKNLQEQKYLLIASIESLLDDVASNYQKIKNFVNQLKQLGDTNAASTYEQILQIYQPHIYQPQQALNQPNNNLLPINNQQNNQQNRFRQPPVINTSKSKKAQNEIDEKEFQKI